MQHQLLALEKGCLRENTNQQTTLVVAERQTKKKKLIHPQLNEDVLLALNLVVAKQSSLAAMLESEVANKH